MFFLILAVLGSPEEDKQLIERLQQRDPDALRELYSRLGRLALSIIVRIVRDRGVAEDLLQETFLRVWNRIASFDAERGSLGPWVLTVARNRAIDHIRSGASQAARASYDLQILERPRFFVDLEAEFAERDRLQQVRGAFEKLSENQRIVLELAYFEGLSQTEMAGRLQQPLGTIKTWVRTGLQILRQELGEAAVHG